MSRTNTAVFVARWNIKCSSARFSEWGNWYAAVNRFPAALIDTNGYIVFESLEKLNSTQGVKFTKQINVPAGISSLSGYILAETILPEEFPSDQTVLEGSKVSVVVNRYERNPAARTACIKHYGFRCSVCGILASEVYGVEAAKLIHVHHLKPISEVGKEYVVDPVQDLRPVCPNCHAFLHLFRPPLSLAEASKRIKK